MAQVTKSAERGPTRPNRVKSDADQTGQTIEDANNASEEVCGQTSGSGAKSRRSSRERESEGKCRAINAPATEENLVTVASALQFADPKVSKGKSARSRPRPGIKGTAWGITEYEKANVKLENEKGGSR